LDYELDCTHKDSQFPPQMMLMVFRILNKCVLFIFVVPVV